jgi:hypothetical protein
MSKRFSAEIACSRNFREGTFSDDRPFTGATAITARAAKMIRREFMTYSSFRDGGMRKRRRAWAGGFVVATGLTHTIGLSLGNTRTPVSTRLQKGVINRAKGNLIHVGMIVTGRPTHLAKVLEVEIPDAPLRNNPYKSIPPQNPQERSKDQGLVPA